MTFKILAIADLHWDLSPEELHTLQSANQTCNLCICLGDIPLDQLRVIKRNVNIPIIGVLGNHDIQDLLEDADIENAHGKVVEIQGLKIAGLSGVPKYTEQPHRILYTQEEAENLLKNISTVPADILISHSGSYNKNVDKSHVGFNAIDNYMKNMRPAYVIHGHDHVPSKKIKKYFWKKNGRRSVTQICVFRVEVIEIVLEQKIGKCFATQRNR